MEAFVRGRRQRPQMFDDDLVMPCIQYGRVCELENPGAHTKEDVIIDSRWDRSNLIQWQYGYISDLGSNLTR